MRRGAAVACTLVLFALLAWWAARSRHPKGAEPPVKPIALAPPESFRPSMSGPNAPSPPARTALTSPRPSSSSSSSAAPEARRTPLAVKPPQAGAASTAASRVQILEEILASKNDNDPRLDTEFRDLSPEAKRLFRRKYQASPPEKRNERGTVVFLLGNNLKAPEDFAFLRDVVGEPACLSLADCSRGGGLDEEGHASGIDVTLAYPQLVALNRVEGLLEAERKSPKGPDAALTREAMSVIAAAKSSPSPIVAQKALEMAGRY